jgi:hypothetical protein
MNGDTAMTTALVAPGRLRMTPARILTLVIGVPLVLGLIGWTGFGVIADFGQASFPVSSYTVPVDHGQLVANVASGNVTVRPVAGTTAHLAANVQYTLIRPAVTEGTTASGTTIGINCHMQIDNCALDATLSVPYNTAVTLSSGGGDIAIAGTGGNVSLSSDGGNVTVSGVGGNASVSTGGGDLTASTLAGRLTFDTQGGDINADTLTAPYLQADSGGGDVSLVFTKPPGYLDITSDGGDVTVVLPHGATTYRVATTPDGGNVSGGVPTSSSASDTITIESGGGDISITEAS